jgi:xanthine dehydrogenase YagT iron-sulfur-binding subunit
MVEPRMTLLDVLRGALSLTGTKKSCDRDERGACTAHVDGRRVLSCMCSATMQKGKRIATIEGLEQNGELHPVQAAFIEHDAFQCGFCTSGQIMSAVAMIEEARAGWPSAATQDVTKPYTGGDLSPPEIRERMSNNLCRCACYPHIVDAAQAAVARYRHKMKRRYFRGDAAFANPQICEFLEAEACKYTIRLPINAVLQERVSWSVLSGLMR